jgi:hypothetical protein
VRAHATTLLAGAVVALGCGCGWDSGEAALTASEYRNRANALCAGEPGDMTKLKPPPHLQALHDRAKELSDRGNRADPRQLASLYGKLELAECVRLYTPDVGDPQACRDIGSLIRDAREERRSWAGEVRAEQETVEEIEQEVREYPEDRAAAQPDLQSSKRLVEEARREVKTAERDIESLQAEALSAGCARKR